ncbi:hypothetical protein [Nocardiopsis sp. NPDC006938]|uniref:hypothetical protein n=1 Tax=Nocardiopsis sp. NPDC006938 TaxID=3364337 RepID=UPI0036C1811E
MWTRLTEGLPTPQWSTRESGPRPVQHTLTFTARLPSASDGLRFEAAFTLQAGLALPDELARNRVMESMKCEVLEVAHRTTDTYALGDHGLAEAALFRALNGPGGYPEAGVRETSVRAVLKVHEEDVALERQRERVGQRAQLARAEHRARMDRVRELVTEVFTDPLTARMWWFEQNQDRWSEIRGAGEALDLLVDQCARRDGTGSVEADTPAEEAVAEGNGDAPADPILAAFLSGVTDQQREALLIRLTDILDAYSRPDLIRQLQQSWSQG